MAEATAQRIVPMLVYKDAPAAIEFLCRVFGFEEKYRLPMPDGRVGHAELEYLGHGVTLSSEYPEMGLVSPQELPTRHMQLTCYVDDVDAHHAHAAGEGATILEAVEDQFYGDRKYRAVDCEGNRWIFATRVREMSPEEIAKAMAEMG
jgi:PhnB protein